MGSKERYASMIGGTAQKVRFESAAQTNKRDDNKIDKGEELCVYLDSIRSAEIARSEQIQEMVDANKAKEY